MFTVPCNIFIVKTGNNPIDVAKVNAIQMSLIRQRVAHMVPHIKVQLHCYTDDPTGLETQFGMNIMPLTLRDNVTNSEFYKLDLFNLEDLEESQNIIVDINAIPLEMCQMFFIDRMPEKGDVSELPKNIELDTETKVRVVEEKLAFLGLQKSWWLEGEPYNSALIKYNGYDAKSLYETFNQNPETAQTTSLAEFIVANWKGLFVSLEPGKLAPFQVGDNEANKQFTNTWDEKVRCYFPDAFEGMGGDPDDKFVYYVHEWKTYNKHLRFFLLEGDEDPRNDLFLRSWVL